MIYTIIRFLESKKPQSHVALLILYEFLIRKKFGIFRGRQEIKTAVYLVHENTKSQRS